MCPLENDELVTTERVGIVVWRLAHGETLTTIEVAIVTGITAEGARLMMIKLSRVLPILYDNGNWQRLTNSALDGL